MLTHYKDRITRSFWSLRPLRILPEACVQAWARRTAGELAANDLDILENRFEIAQVIRFDADPIIGEIGVFKCEFARFLFETYRPKRLHLFDLFRLVGQMGSGDVDGNNTSSICGGEIYQIATDTFRHFDTVALHEGYSQTTVRQMPDEYFDLMYIDGDHSYEGCLADLRNSYLKVKDGGWIAGHDFAVNLKKCETWWEFGVRKAVRQFCSETNLKVNALFLDGCVSYAIRVQK